jgi:hypothetical protein
VTWTQFNSGAKGAGFKESPIVMALSTDHGHTWNRQGSPVADASHPFDQGSYPVYGSDGTLYVAYEAADPRTNFATDVTVIARSTDDGQNFVNVPVGRVFDDLDCYPIFAGRQTLSDEHFRLNSYPSMSVDPVSGVISLVWTDQQGSGTCGAGGSSFTGAHTSNQVKLLRGSWAGIGAASVVPVTTSVPDKVFPSVASYNGNLVITYYTRDGAFGTGAPGDVCHWRTNDLGGARVAPSPSVENVCLNYAATFWSSGGGFSAQRILTGQASNPYVQFADGSFIGDYSQVAMGSNGVAHASWTDFRGNPGTTTPNQDVLVANFTR